MTTLTTVTAVQRAVVRDRATYADDSEWGATEEPGYVQPYWLDLPAQRLVHERDPWATYTIDHEEWWPGMHEPEPVCEHGLSEWLCAGPGHYPADRAW